MIRLIALALAAVQLPGAIARARRETPIARAMRLYGYEARAVERAFQQLGEAALRARVG